MSNSPSVRYPSKLRRGVQLMGLMFVTRCPCFGEPTSAELDASCKAGTVEVTTPIRSVEVGGFVKLQAVFRAGPQECELTLPSFDWSSSAPGIATVSSVGLAGGDLVGIALGEATVTATLLGTRTDSLGAALRGSITISVVAGDVVRIEIIPPGTGVPVGSTVQLTATLKNSSGATVPGGPISWRSETPRTASVSPSGLVTGVAGGPAIITASFGAISASVTFAIVGPPPAPVDRVDVAPPIASIPAGGTVQLTATARDAAGNVLTGRTLTWRSDAAAVATVSATGLVTGASPGTATVSADVEGKTGSSTITVVDPAAGRYAYALADDPTAPSYAASAANAYSSAGQPITIARAGVGQYQVQFEGLQPAAGHTQVLQVTGYGAGAATCKIAAVATTATGITASVNCYAVGDAPADQPFLILLLGSDALPGRFAFGWADRPTIDGPYTLSAAHSSSGQSVQVRRDLNGVYTVIFHGQARAAGGVAETALVTAAGAGPPRCTLNSFLLGVELAVHCVGPAETAFVDDDAAFMVVLMEAGPPGRRFAFASISGAGAVDQAHTSSTAGSVTASRVGSGRIDVTFAGLGRTATNGTETVQVAVRTEFGAFCKVLGWHTAGADLVANIQCYDFEGLPADQEFRILVMR